MKSILFKTGDNWMVECSGEFWQRDDFVRFKHKDTNK